MARVSKAEKAKNHQRIVEEAAKQIRSNGIEGLGISDLMKSVGMTHGGFYRHFKDKEDLSVAAIDHAFAKFSERLAGDIERLGPLPALEAFVERYLSKEHVKNPSVGCPASALGGEALKSTENERKAIARGIARIENLLSEAMSGLSLRVSAVSLFSLLVGAIVMARAAISEMEVERILGETRGLLAEVGLGSLKG